MSHLHLLLLLLLLSLLLYLQIVRGETLSDFRRDGSVVLDLDQGLQLQAVCGRQVWSVTLHKSQQGLVPHDWHL